MPHFSPYTDTSENGQKTSRSSIKGTLKAKFDHGVDHGDNNSVDTLRDTERIFTEKNGYHGADASRIRYITDQKRDGIWIPRRDREVPIPTDEARDGLQLLYLPDVFPIRKVEDMVRQVAEERRISNGFTIKALHAPRIMTLKWDETANRFIGTLTIGTPPMYPDIANLINHNFPWQRVMNLILGDKIQDISANDHWQPEWPSNTYPQDS